MNRCLIMIVLLSLFSQSGCALNRSTHHSVIHVWLSESNNESATVADVHALERILDTWAMEYQFLRCAGNHRQHTSTTNAAGSVITIYYKQKNPTDADWPIEVMVACDLQSHPTLVQVATCEGYGARPTGGLERIHQELLQRLKRQFGETVKGSIW